ncbi:MAG: prolyl oligopeptidase family serine peptidase, partial [Alphaproteobacteria bacterium]|nr:prolyl oligopeptidase family serine peptidase [Alphaproteobacteria bacterium]
MAEGLEYFSLKIFAVSPDHRYIAVGYDQNGSERLILKILDTTQNTYLPLELDNISSNGLVWKTDSSGFYFQTVDENWRSNQVYYYDFKAHLDGKSPSPLLIFKEEDATNHVGISRSTDTHHMLIDVSDPKDNVTHVIDLDTPEHSLYTPIPRKTNIKYDMGSAGADWIIMTTDQGANKRLLMIPKNAAQPADLDKAYEIAPYHKHDPLVDFNVYQTHVVYSGKHDGVPFLKIWDRATKTTRVVELGMESFTLSLAQQEYAQPFCRVHVSNLITPGQTMHIDLKTGDPAIIKQRDVPNFHSTDYVTRRHSAPAPDGVQIPYTIAYKKGTDLSTAPTYLYGYGSYGYPTEPNFRATFLPLMNKGYVVVLGHIRGGSDLGRAWYEAAKLKTKIKTFTDFISIAEDMIKRNIAQKGNITIAGGSAGGMLVGAVVNMRPDLFQSVVAMVPFVDVLNTMMDGSLPLTPGEYHE